VFIDFGFIGDGGREDIVLKVEIIGPFAYGKGRFDIRCPGVIIIGFEFRKLLVELNFGRHCTYVRGAIDV
jgi:hypothetical protein